MIDIYKNLFSTGFFIFLLLLMASATNAASFKQDYDRAYKSFESAKTNAEITKVAGTFRLLSQRKDAGKLIANTYYWQGACWFRLSKYTQSLQKFEKVLTYPLSYKEEDARYKVATCYQRLKEYEIAKWEYNRFLRDYPQSKLAGTVRNQLTKMGSN